MLQFSVGAGTQDLGFRGEVPIVLESRPVVPLQSSSWLAVRCFPQLHTNPADVLVAGRPIRVSAASARWCAETIRRLWDVREKDIADAERSAARTAFDRAIERYERIAREAALALRLASGRRSRPLCRASDGRLHTSLRGPRRPPWRR